MLACSCNCGRVVMRALLVIFIALAACLLQACAGPPRTTKVTMRDLDDMATIVALNLRNSDWMTSRDSTSEQVVVAMDKVENLTDDIIPSGEQWAIMTKIRTNANMVRIGREKAISFVIPKEFLIHAQQSGNIDNTFADLRSPTHEMSATLRNTTRSIKDARTDVYICEFRITALATGELKWLDTFELKRQAFGLTFD